MAGGRVRLPYPSGVTQSIKRNEIFYQFYALRIPINVRAAVPKEPITHRRYVF